MLDLIQKAHVKLKTFKRDEDGAALVEYGVILLIAVTVGVLFIGGAFLEELTGIFEDVATVLGGDAPDGR